MSSSTVEPRLERHSLAATENQIRALLPVCSRAEEEEVQIPDLSEALQ